MSSQSHVIFNPNTSFFWLTDPNLNSLCMLFRLYTVYYFQYTYYNFLQTSICAWFKGFFQCFWRVLTGCHRRKRRSRRPSWEMGWYYGGCLEFPGKWMKKTITSDSPLQNAWLWVQVVSVKKSIQSIVMKDLFWVVMSNDEQWRSGKCYTLDIVTTVKGGLTDARGCLHAIVVNSISTLWKDDMLLQDTAIVCTYILYRLYHTYFAYTIPYIVCICTI